MFWFIFLIGLYFIIVFQFKKRCPEQYAKNMEDNKKLARSAGETAMKILGTLLKK